MKTRERKIVVLLCFIIVNINLFANGTANGFESSSDNFAVVAEITGSGDQTVSYSSPKFQISGSAWSQSGTLTITVSGQTVSAVSLIGSAIEWTNWENTNNITLAASSGVATATIAGNLNVTIDLYLYFCSSNNTLYYSGTAITTPVDGCAPAGPAISTSTATLLGFSYCSGAGPSAYQSFTVSGAALTGSVTFTAPTNYDISTNSSFSNSSPLTLTQTGGVLDGQPVTIYVRLKSGLGVGDYNGENIVLSGGGSSNVNVACSGTVNAGATITVSQTTRTGFAYVETNGPSSSQNYSVSGSCLSDDITITAPTNYEVSIDNTNFYASRTLTQSGGTVSSTTIYVRLKAGLSENDYNGEVITHTSSGATQKDVTCSGSVTAGVVYYSRSNGNWNDFNTWSSTCGGSAGIGVPPNDAIVQICNGNVVNLNANASIGRLTITGSGSRLAINNSTWENTFTVTGNTYIQDGGSISDSEDWRKYTLNLNNVYVGYNSTSGTSTFSITRQTNNNSNISISGMLYIGNCAGNGTADFNYSPNLSGGTNSLTIANRTIYPNGTYTYGCSGGSCPSAPSNTTAAACPTITASSSTINGNSYVFGAGPSVAKSVTLTGENLVGSGDIVVSTASADYEISPDNATWGTTFNLPFAGGVITAEPKTLYVRLKAGKAKGSYNGATVSLVGGSASTTITLNGMVTATISAAQSTLTPVSSNLTANGSSNLSLTVTVYDTDGNVAAIPGQTITITKQSGGGTLGAVSDNGDGTYTALLTSPTTTGSGVFVATVNGSEVQNNTGSQTQATIAYVAGEPSQLSIQAGNNQTAMPGTTVATAPSVLVTDANGNPVSGVNVTFKVTQGNGEVSDIVVVSNASGIATLGYWELGPNPGTNKVVATATSSSTSKAIRYPFPHATRQQYPYGISATNVDYVDLQDKIDTWITNYYVEGDCYGTGDCARIKWDDPNLTVSEGIAYGMLIFVYTDNETNNYKDKFDKLWTYYKKWSTSGGGLMTWRIEGFSNVNPGDTGAATDADIDAALALIQAHKQWGSTGAVNYIQEAETILAKIYDHEVENNLFKPGDGWNSVQNPSYAALFAVKKAMEIQVDEDFTQTRGWASVYTTLQNYLLHYQNDNTGLWPNWTQPDVAGTCVVSGHGSGGYSEGCWYGLDALRTPWRVAWDHAWYGTANSATMLNTLSDWLNSSDIAGDPNNVIGKFTNISNITNGAQTAYPLDEPGFVAGLAAAYMADNNATDQEDLNEWYANLMARDLSNPGTLSINHPDVLADPDTYGYQYYSPTLQILMGLTLSGNTPDFNTLDPVIADPVEFTATGDGLLPIQLLKFTASPQEKSVLLEWSTATESQNDYFTLYKSSKTEQFTPIATVQGAGNSNVLQSYEYIDTDVTHGMLYYQLSQTDYNGTQSFSDIVSVYFEPKNFEIISCKSDKQTTATTIEIQFLQYDEVNTLRIVNVVGQIMFEQKFTQTLYEQIELSLPPGMYTIVNSVQTVSSKQKILIK
ncbi:MAG: Endoglucanase C precursor [Bacteroidetes bacterium ADurb.Bin217]|nr:MAG: Endoglucanase C precursor [Bacteroidetes bacterium ADurb.Bin217]